MMKALHAYVILAFSTKFTLWYQCMYKPAYSVSASNISKSWIKEILWLELPTREGSERSRPDIDGEAPIFSHLHQLMWSTLLIIIHNTSFSCYFQMTCLMWLAFLCCWGPYAVISFLIAFSDVYISPLVSIVPATITKTSGKRWCHNHNMEKNVE